MRDQGIDALWLNNEPEFYWLTGFNTAFWLSPTRAWHLLLPASGDPVAVIPSIGRECYARTGFVDVRCFDSPHPAALGIDLLVDTFNDLGLTASVIGRLEGPATWARVPLGDVMALEARLPRASWRDATSLMHELRHIKSEAEITRLRSIITMTSRLYDAVPSLVSTGQTEQEIFRAVRQQAHALGIDEVPYLVGGAGQGGITDIISPPSARALQVGDVLMLDSGCKHDGYFSDFDRNWAIGKVSHATRSAYRAAWDATEAGLKAARPGIECRDLYRVMHDILAPVDTDSSGGVGRLGHGLGIELTESPSLTPYDTTVLKPGMALTLEPALQYENQYVMVHEENILITDAGCELLSDRAPQDIPII